MRQNEGEIMIITEIPKSWARLDRSQALEADLRNMTAAKELAERQVAALVSAHGCTCPPFPIDCRRAGRFNSTGITDCRECVQDWSRAEAEKGGK
jgi:hypothetical protein